MDTKYPFSDNLKRYRNVRGFSLTQLADFAFTSISSLRKYEYGTERLPRIKTIAALATALQVSANDLLAGMFGHSEVDDLLELKSFLSQDPCQTLHTAQMILTNLVDYLELHTGGLAEAGFGRRIKILREDMGLDYETVAKACAIGAGHLKQIESAQVLPTTTAFLTLCDLMGASPDYFMRNMYQRPEGWVSGIPLLDRIAELTPRQISLLAKTARIIF